MATINSINNTSNPLASTAVTVDPAAATDSYCQFDESTTGKWRIGNDATDDSYRLSQGSALGTNDVFISTSAGEITKPLTPAFLAKRNSTLSNVTGDGTNYGPIVWDTEVFDQNGDYNNGTGTFTAPITGRYSLTVGMYLTGIAAGHSRGTFVVTTSNGLFYFIDVHFGNLMNSSNAIRFANTVLADMDASDTVTVNLLVANGAKTVDIFGDGTNDKYSYFAGYLVC